MLALKVTTLASKWTPKILVATFQATKNTTTEDKNLDFVSLLWLGRTNRWVEQPLSRSVVVAIEGDVVVVAAVDFES